MWMIFYNFMCSAIKIRITYYYTNSIEIYDKLFNTASKSFKL